MKGAIMSFWNLSVTIGNWCWSRMPVCQTQRSQSSSPRTGFGVTAFQMFSFAVFGFALIFGLVARTILWSITTANSRETDYQN
ncbi:MAG: hypothetical protein DME38_04270 [Verrucomicrobia bacterium]|nr:MAG: hypothetical protein DME38_04270 [Verrucomicrobiota bacterium]